MEQTQTLALSTELAKLPDVLNQNSSLADRAVNTVRNQIEPLKSIDLTTVDVITMDEHDQNLNNLQVKLKDAYTLMNDRRKPFTQRMDEIKAMFTGEEKKLTQIGEEVKAIRDSWQREKGRRSRIAEEEKAKELEKKQGLIEARNYFVKHLHDKCAELIVKMIYRMHDKFNAQTIEQIEQYAATLSTWKPVLGVDQWNEICAGTLNPKPQILTGEAMTQMFAEVQESEGPKLKAQFESRLTEERNKLVELVPSRKMELERIAGDAAAQKEAEERIAKEREELAAQAEQEKKDREAAAQVEQEVQSMNAAFEVEAGAAPVVGMAKGTQVKKKYVAKTHQAWAAIMQSWVKNDMAGFTLDELQKKLGFMRTACEGRLNKGEELTATGLEVEEDYSTRSSRKTA